MNLKEIISVSGKPGLYKILSQGKSGLIVEHIQTKVRSTISLNRGVSSLSEISMYTQNKEVSLTEIMRRIAEKEDNKEVLSSKSEEKKLISYFSEILPDYDREKVYVSHIKKLISWYNELSCAGLVSKEIED